jgi:hypothetical protein
MKTLLKLAVPVAACLAVALAPKDAHALGPIGIEVGAKVGGASDSGPLPLGFGAGGRAGVTLFGLYGGLNAMYYLGGTPSGPAAIVGSTHATQVGGELGYGFKLLDLLTIRPQVGAGNISFSSSGPSTSSFYLEPGVTGLITLGILYVGADINALIVTGQQNFTVPGNGAQTAMTVHGQVGLTF